MQGAEEVGARGLAGAMAEAAASLMKGGGSEVKGGEESKDITDLFGLIETQTMECLNQDNAHPVTHCLGQVRAPSPLHTSSCRGRQSCVATLPLSLVALDPTAHMLQRGFLLLGLGVQTPQPDERDRTKRHPGTMRSRAMHASARPAWRHPAIRARP